MDTNTENFNLEGEDVDSDDMQSQLQLIVLGYFYETLRLVHDRLLVLEMLCMQLNACLLAHPELLLSSVLFSESTVTSQKCNI